MKDDKCTKKIIIECDDVKETCNTRDYIHNQLVGNKNYINNDIILKCDDLDHTIRIFFFNDATIRLGSLMV